MSRSVPPSPGRRGLKRDPALVPLSRDHHFTLRHALWMRRAAGASDRRAAERVAREYVVFHRDELTPHMADEETVVFPAFEGFDPAGTDRLRSEHREIDALTARLSDALDGDADPRPLMGELASLLDDHVRYEERAYFMALQERLSASVMMAIGEAVAQRPRVCPNR
jgi:hemerythrin-like domain-containing protein